MVAPVTLVTRFVPPCTLKSGNGPVSLAEKANSGLQGFPVSSAVFGTKFDYFFFGERGGQGRLEV